VRDEAQVLFSLSLLFFFSELVKPETLIGDRFCWRITAVLTPTPTPTPPPPAQIRPDCQKEQQASSPICKFPEPVVIFCPLKRHYDQICDIETVLENILFANTSE
jgi:hypothetical protein